MVLLVLNCLVVLVVLVGLDCLVDLLGLVGLWPSRELLVIGTLGNASTGQTRPIITVADVMLGTHVPGAHPDREGHTGYG